MSFNFKPEMIEELLALPKEQQQEIYNDFLLRTKEIDSTLTDLYYHFSDLILEKSAAILTMMKQVVASNYYIDCYRGMFGALVLDINKESVFGPAFNQPPKNMLDICRFSEEKCTRMLGDHQHGSGYDLCPALHARERIHIPRNVLDRNNLVWAEGGTILVENKMDYWGMYIQSVKDRIYPCKTCLNYSLNQKVKVFAALYPDSTLSFHDVEKHAELLLIRKIINDS